MEVGFVSKRNFFKIPNSNVQTLAPLSALDFYDRRSILLPKVVTPLEAWAVLMARPMLFMKLAFLVRDKISALFGVRQLGGFTGRVPKVVKAGDMLDFFLVEHIACDVLILTERDRHLDVMTCITTHGAELTITSSVITHNTFGWFYMKPVGPAHKLIVHNNLKQIKRRLTLNSL